MLNIKTVSWSPGIFTAINFGTRSSAERNDDVKTGFNRQ